MLTMRSVLIAALIVGSVIAGSVAGATVIGASSEPRESHGAVEPGGLAGVRGSDTIEHVKPDPGGEGREWAVTVFRAKNGQTCAAPGRKQGTRVGQIAPDGSFVPYPIEDGATCVDLRGVPAGAQVTSTPSEGRTTVHGIAGPKVRQISLTVNGETRELAIGPRGAFFAVLGPEADPESLNVSATLEDGSVVMLIGRR